jgi:hypothetical protein
MSYEIILADGTAQHLQISEATFKTWKVWRIQFDDDKEAMLYKCGIEWVQRNEDHLDAYHIMEIGKYIDGISHGKISLSFDDK